MKDIAYDFEIPDASRPGAGRLAHPVDTEALLARARVMRAKALRRMLSRVAAHLRRRSGRPVDATEQAIYDARCRDAEALRRAGVAAAQAGRAAARRLKSRWLADAGVSHGDLLEHVRPALGSPSERAAIAAEFARAA